MEDLAAEKAAVQAEKLEQDRIRQRHEARTLEMYHLRSAEEKSSAFHRRVFFLRQQHGHTLTHSEARHKLERRQLTESQDIEARNLRLAQELEAKQLPPHMQASFLQLCEMAARQLRATQDRRATRLNEVQLLESQHSTLSFDRFLKMATERFHMDMRHMNEEQSAVARHVSLSLYRALSLCRALLLLAQRAGQLFTMLLLVVHSPPLHVPPPPSPHPLAMPAPLADGRAAGRKQARRPARGQAGGAAAEGTTGP